MPRLSGIAISWSIRNKTYPIRPIFRILLHSSVVMAVILLNSAGQSEIIDRIVAIVNEEIITLSELEEFRTSFYRTNPNENDWLEEEFDLLETREQVLNLLIDEKLIDQEATRQRISVPQKQVEKTIESLRKEQGLSQAQLEMALKAQGLTFEEYTAKVEKGLKRTRLINQIVKSKIEIKEEDLRTYYKNHTENYMIDESIRISHILLPLTTNPTKTQEQAALSTVKDILMRVESGEDFATLAREYRQTHPGMRAGDLGYFKRGEMIPAIEKTAFRLEVGKVGGPIRTQEGLILIRVTEKKDGSPIPLDKIRQRVEKDYQKSESERRYRQWLSKLRERSFIEMKL